MNIRRNFNMIVSVDAHDLFYQVGRQLYVGFMFRNRNQQIVQSFPQDFEIQATVKYF